MENKEDKFQRIAANRLPKTIKAIELMENLGSSAYACSRKDAEAIVTALNDAVNKVSEAYGIEVVDTTKFTPMPLNESYARWAFDKLQAGKTKDGIELLRKAIKGD